MEKKAETEIPLPSQKVMQHVCKLACTHDKPIMMDYWLDSHCGGKVIIGVKDSEEKILVRNEEEYTSPISKVYKVGDEFILITENSIYLVSSKIQSRKIT
jgi:hypothetical protein|uniref:Uncharacterized protein n=1 Tax=viral metagenome TaxID=1070528 RepID=A0A6C0ESS6_9ZZZZ